MGSCNVVGTFLSLVKHSYLFIESDLVGCTFSYALALQYVIMYVVGPTSPVWRIVWLLRSDVTFLDACYTALYHYSSVGAGHWFSDKLFCSSSSWICGPLSEKEIGSADEAINLP